MLLIFRPFKVGDVVKAAGETGTVDEVAPFNTREAGISIPFPQMDVHLDKL